jgi:hypothetical protein
MDARLCGGEYFLSIGVGEYNGEAWTFFDNRRSSIHLSVARSERASGFIEVPSDCVVVRGPHNAVT